MQDEILAKLQWPFEAHEISLLPKTTSKDGQKRQCNECGGYHAFPCIHLSYVGHAALTKRLLQVDPCWNWEPLAFDDTGNPAFDKIGGMWIRLTVGGMTRLGYGNPDGKTGGNAIKEAIGDALRNAAMRFGCALDLWHKGDLFDADELKGLYETAGQEAPKQKASSAPKLKNMSDKAVEEKIPKWFDEGLTLKQVIENAEKNGLGFTEKQIELLTAKLPSF